VLFAFATSVVSAAPGVLEWPFEPGPTWGIIQGYNYGTHPSTNYQRYSFDLTRDDGQQQGKSVLAMGSGNVVWQSGSCLAINLGNYGGSYYLVMTCHVNYSRDWRGANVSQGTILGTVAAPGTDNNWVSHIHITLYRASYPGAPSSQRTGVPFSGSFKVSGYDFPANDSIPNQYVGTRGLRIGCPAYPYPGQDSSRWWLFQQAYDRWGGREALGCATGPTYWWNGGGGWLVRQNFSGGAGSPCGAGIIHDEGRDDPIGSLPAWVVGGQFWCYYQNDSSLGPLVSDQYAGYYPPYSPHAQIDFWSGFMWYPGSLNIQWYADDPWRWLDTGGDSTINASFVETGGGERCSWFWMGRVVPAIG
jgi:hypothetical protein